MQRGVSFLGLIVFLAVAVGLSRNRRAIPWKVVGGSLGIQLVLALLLLKTSGGQAGFRWFGEATNSLMAYSNKGIEFVFGQLANPGGAWGFVFAIKVLPTIIFFASLMNVLYYLGVMQAVVAIIAKGMQRLLGTSGAETLCAAANIFMGQTEAPLMIRPYIARLTQSELLVVMVAGFSTLAAGVMFVYASMLSPFLPSAAGHLLAASVLSAPAAIMMAKIVIPETEVPVTGQAKSPEPEEDRAIGVTEPEVPAPTAPVTRESNVIEAAASGAATGLNLALNVGAMLIAFISLVALINGALGKVGLSLEGILGTIFQPLAFLMGADGADLKKIGAILGQSLVLNEFVAFGELRALMEQGSISARSAVLTIYALCGFTNLSSVAIQIGGIGALAENRKGDLAKLGFLALATAVLVNLQTAALVGLILGPESLTKP
jgi:CNT family concentrative nucleoside transporter